MHATGWVVAAPARRWLRDVRSARRDLRADALAGLPGAVSSVPDGMASAVLVGVNPVFAVLADYARRLAAVDGRLHLSGVGPELAATLRRTGQVDVDGPVRVVDATEQIGESTRTAYADGTAWAVQHRGC